MPKYQESITTKVNTIGIKIKIPALMKITSDLSLIILIRSTIGHPIGDVFLIMKDTVRIAVSRAMFLSKVFLTLMK